MGVVVVKSVRLFFACVLALMFFCASASASEVDLYRFHYVNPDADEEYEAAEETCYVAHNEANLLMYWSGDPGNPASIDVYRITSSTPNKFTAKHAESYMAYIDGYQKVDAGMNVTPKTLNGTLKNNVLVLVDYGQPGNNLTLKKSKDPLSKAFPKKFINKYLKTAGVSSKANAATRFDQEIFRKLRPGLSPDRVENLGKELGYYVFLYQNNAGAMIGGHLPADSVAFIDPGKKKAIKIIEDLWGTFEEEQRYEGLDVAEREADIIVNNGYNKGDPQRIVINAGGIKRLFGAYKSMTEFIPDIAQKYGMTASQLKQFKTPKGLFYRGKDMKKGGLQLGVLSDGSRPIRIELRFAKDDTIELPK